MEIEMTTHEKYHIPWYLWPLALIWRLLAIIIGILLMIVGVIVSGIGRQLTFRISRHGGDSFTSAGFDLLIKGIFGVKRRGDPPNESKIPDDDDKKLGKDLQPHRVKYRTLKR